LARRSPADSSVDAEWTAAVQLTRGAQLMTGNLSRRAFLGTAAAAALAARRGRAAPSARLTIGMIGAGGMNGGHLGGLLTQADVQVLAVADPQQSHREGMAQTVNRHYGNQDCRAYNDFRELVARDDLDAVMIATPDHWHALCAIAAARAGKHIYSEKPFSRTLAEGRAMVEAVGRHGVVFQHGTQQRSDGLFRRACELVRNGYLGKLQRVHVSAPGGAQRDAGQPGPVPPGVDWDLWLGPAPWSPYSPQRITSNYWYFTEDYSAGGFISGWGIHHVDIAQWGLGTELTGPSEIEGTAVFPEGGIADTPIHWDVTYRFGDGPPVRFTSDDIGPVGVTFEGQAGSVWVTRGSWRATPESLMQLPPSPDEIHLPRSADHHRNWLDAIKTGAPTIAPPEVGHRSQTICLLSDIAVRLGRKLRWDPAAERVIGDDSANRLLSRAMREPWSL
jgi:predicted dehydrogenase